MTFQQSIHFQPPLLHRWKWLVPAHQQQRQLQQLFSIIQQPSSMIQYNQTRLRVVPAESEIVLFLRVGQIFMFETTNTYLKVYMTNPSPAEQSSTPWRKHSLPPGSMLHHRPTYRGKQTPHIQLTASFTRTLTFGYRNGRWMWILNVWVSVSAFS